MPQTELAQSTGTLGIDEEKLSRFMMSTIEGLRAPFQVSQLTGGQSNPTYKVQTPDASYVIRQKPPGKLAASAHAIDREFRVIKALNETDFPVPHAFLYCADKDVLGTEFYIMAFVPGRVFWNHRMPELSQADRGAALRSVCQNLAKLHSYNYHQLGLEDFGRPGNYFARQVSRWTKAYLANETEKCGAMENLIDWLPSAIPDDDSASLVHGDYALHNLIFDPTQPKIVGVLDWELATIGHPLGDLFYSALAYYVPEEDPGKPGGYSDLDCAAHGLPSFDEYLGLYCELTGRAQIENPFFYKAFNLFRIAGISQGIIGRIKAGNANDRNANTEHLSNRVNIFAEAAWREAQKAGAL